MGKKNADNEIEEIIEDAREGFDLRARLRGVSHLTEDVTVYTDIAAGRELGGTEDQENQFGIKVGTRRWGLTGELSAIGEQLEELQKQDDPDEGEVKALVAKLASTKKKIPAALKKLESSALVFTLRAIPDLVQRDARRQARKALGIKAKGIPEGREEEFNLEHIAHIVAASVESWTDNASGKKFSSLTVEEAKALRDELPIGQFALIDQAIGKLSYQAQIGKVATDSADF